MTIGVHLYRVITTVSAYARYSLHIIKLYGIIIITEVSTSLRVVIW